MEPSRIDSWLDEQVERIERREAVVGVIGLGYVGLPLALAFADSGFRVIGFDIDGRRVSSLNAGTSHIQDVADTRLRTLVQSGAFRATEEFGELANVHTVSVCVPTPVREDKSPDLSFVMSAVEQIKRYLCPGQLVAIESTTYPGTTCEEIAPLLEQTGLNAGEDFYLAFSPERIDPGNPKYDLKNTPKIIGGLTPKCATLALTLYSKITDKVVVVGSPTSAELVKLLENTFRAVNIGLASEFAAVADRLGVDIWEVIDAAATKPFGFMPFYPGPGVGGHCIPVDPHYLLWKMASINFPTPLIETGMQAIESMPHFVVDQVAKALSAHGKELQECRITVLGVTYKKDVADVRESPALEVLALLQRRGARIAYIDRYVPELRVENNVLRSVEMTPEILLESDCVVIVTDHSHVDYSAVLRDAPLVIDTRNATKAFAEATNVWRLVQPTRAYVSSSARSFASVEA